MTLNQFKSAAARRLYAKIRIKEICQDIGVPLNLIIGKSHKRDDVTKRKQVAGVMREEGFNASTIARAMNRDHTTILVYFNGKKR